jgi:predicted Zn-dependent protease
MKDDGEMLLARVLLAVLAVAACAWFALGAEQARDTGQAKALLSSSTQVSPATATRVRSLLSSASTLNPDSTVDLLRAQLATAQSHPRKALRIVESVVAREPDNADAWVALARVALNRDPAAVERAIRNIARLVPRFNG